MPTHVAISHLSDNLSDDPHFFFYMVLVSRAFSSVLHTLRGFKVQMYDHAPYQGDKTGVIVQKHRQEAKDHSFRKR